jgi:tRNA1Val (adenine37-N6)-methyltransferase
LEKFTANNFFNKNISISQPEKGYRFSMDPFILTAQVQLKESKKIIDIGTGCAIIPLILSTKHPDLKIIGIEIQEELARFAKRNVVANSRENTIQIILNDIKNVKSSDMGGKADIIVSNPPYKKKNSGRLNPDSQKAVARHEIALDIDTLFDCSNRLLNKYGRIYVIFPAERLSDLILSMERHKFGLDTIKFVHTKKDAPAKMVIVCAKKNSRQNCIVKPPIYIDSEDNK